MGTVRKSYFSLKVCNAYYSIYSFRESKIDKKVKAHQLILNQTIVNELFVENSHDIDSNDIGPLCLSL